jgi:hypothetical protein
MIRERLQEILEVVGYTIWRGFGIFLFVLGGSAAAGALFTGDIFTGVLIAWSTLMLGIIGAIGYAIATTGKATKETVHEAANDAIRKFEEQKEKK